MIATLACLLVAQSSSADTPALLRRDVAHASSHVYVMSFTMAMDMSGIPNAPAGMGNQTVTTTGTYREVLTPMRGNKGKVQITVSEMHVGSSFLPKGDEQKSNTQMSMTVDPLNRITFGKLPDFGRSTVAGLFGGQNPLGMSGAFPEKPVRYGDSWSIALGGVSSGMSDMAGVTATYLGEETMKGIPCWRTQMAVDMDLGSLMSKVMSNSKGDASMQMTPTGMMSMTGTSLYAKKDGSLVRSYGSGMGTFSLNAAGQDIKIKMQVNLDLTRIQ